MLPEQAGDKSGSSEHPGSTVGGATNIIGLLGISTQQAITEAGGFSAISRDWYMMVDWANQAFINSQVNARLQIMALGGVNYQESGNMFVDADHFWTCPDGVMDEICGWRDQYGGDIAQLAGTGYFEQGYAGVATMPGWGSVIDWRALSSGDASAHEIGHNMGGGHDRYQGFRGWFPDSYAYIDPDGWFSTILAYSDRPRYQGHSNPDVYWSPPKSGLPARPTGTVNDNNARALNYFAPIIAGWK